MSAPYLALFDCAMTMRASVTLEAKHEHEDASRMLKLWAISRNLEYIEQARESRTLDGGRMSWYSARVDFGPSVTDGFVLLINVRVPS